MLRAQLLLDSQANQMSPDGAPLAGPKPTNAVCTDGVKHFPDNVTKTGRTCATKGCSKRTIIWCVKCRQYLCLVNRAK